MIDTWRSHSPSLPSFPSRLFLYLYHYLYCRRTALNLPMLHQIKKQRKTQKKKTRKEKQRSRRKMPRKSRKIMSWEDCWQVKRCNVIQKIFHTLYCICEYCINHPKILLTLLFSIQHRLPPFPPYPYPYLLYVTPFPPLFSLFLPIISHYFILSPPSHTFFCFSNLSLSFYRYTFPQSLLPSHNVLELTYSLYSIPATLSLTYLSLSLSLSFLFLCSLSFPLPVFTLSQYIHISYLQFSSLFLFSIWEPFDGISRLLVSFHDSREQGSS